jgi:hypothetical protein
MCANFSVSIFGDRAQGHCRTFHDSDRSSSRIHRLTACIEDVVARIQRLPQRISELGQLLGCRILSGHGACTTVNDEDIVLLIPVYL